MTRQLPLDPNLENLKKQAKSLLKSYKAGDPRAISTIEEYFDSTVRVGIKRAQLIIAREYGFDSWDQLRAHIGDLGKTVSTIPIVPLKGEVYFPDITKPLFIGTKKSIRAATHSWNNDPDHRLLLVAKKDPFKEEPGFKDLFRFGTLVKVEALINVPDENVIKLVVSNGRRANITKITDSSAFFVGDVQLIETPKFEGYQTNIVITSLIEAFRRYANDQMQPDTQFLEEAQQHIDSGSVPLERLSGLRSMMETERKKPDVVIDKISSIEEPDRLVDAVASAIRLNVDEQQKLLELVNIEERASYLIEILEGLIGSGVCHRN